MVIPPPFDTRVHQIAWILAGVCVAVAVIVSVHLIRGHLRHFTVAREQSKARDNTNEKEQDN